VTPVTTILEDTAERTVTRIVDTARGFESVSTVYKAGTPQFNQQALATRNLQAIADCSTAEGLLNASGWDGLTANQRKAIMLGVVQALRAQARLNLNQFDSPS
jgi:hypothetical protein